MLTVHSPRHAPHHGNAELIDGRLMPCFEMPRRVDLVLAAHKHRAAPLAAGAVQ